MIGEKGGVTANDIVEEWPSEKFQYLIYCLNLENLLGLNTNKSKDGLWFQLESLTLDCEEPFGHSVETKWC